VVADAPSCDIAVPFGTAASLSFLRPQELVESTLLRVVSSSAFFHPAFFFVCRFYPFSNVCCRLSPGTVVSPFLFV
jgi:hypothetical protein